MSRYLELATEALKATNNLYDSFGGSTNTAAVPDTVMPPIPPNPARFTPRGYGTGSNTLNYGSRGTILGNGSWGRIGRHLRNRRSQRYDKTLISGNNPIASAFPKGAPKYKRADFDPVYNPVDLRRRYRWGNKDSEKGDWIPMEYTTKGGARPYEGYFYPQSYSNGKRLYTGRKLSYRNKIGFNMPSSSNLHTTSTEIKVVIPPMFFRNRTEETNTSDHLNYWNQYFAVSLPFNLPPYVGVGKGYCMEIYKVHYEFVGGMVHEVSCGIGNQDFSEAISSIRKQTHHPNYTETVDADPTDFTKFNEKRTYTSDGHLCSFSETDDVSVAGRGILFYGRFMLLTGLVKYYYEHNNWLRTSEPIYSEPAPMSEGRIDGVQYESGTPYRATINVRITYRLKKVSTQSQIALSSSHPDNFTSITEVGAIRESADQYG